MRTIFVSISNPVTYRNFALLPQSVIATLGKEKNLRIVLLIKKGLFPQLRSMFASPNFIIEEFDENQRKNFLQSVFQFFYSYLIFTDTTKLVSSYGVRADKPRPLIKYWNFPVKWVLANTLGKSRYVKERMAPWFYLHFFTSRPYGYLFDRYHPDLAFLTNICIWPADLEFLAEARRRGVKTIGMPANWDHLSKYYIPFKPEKLLVWSRQVKREALLYQGYDAENVKIIGSPQLDFFVRPENFMPRSDFLKKLNFPQSGKLISFFSQGPYSLDGADLVDMILKWIEAGKLPNNLCIIIRPHPNGRHEIDKYLPFKDNPKIYIDDVEGWSSMERVLNYLNILYHSDVVLTTYSSIATEASIFDRPTIIAGFDGYKQRPAYQSVRRHKAFTHFQYLLGLGAMKVTESQRDFLDAIKEYLENPAKDREARMKLREEVFGFADGRNAARICSEIMSRLS